MNILVTGGAGFIGSHLAEALLQKKHRVTVIDDLSNGKRSYIEHMQRNPRFSFVHGSVLDRELLKSLMNECDAVFHMAAVLGVKNTVEHPLKVIEGNIDGTRNVLELAYPQRIKVIFASTSEVYGKNPELPFAETSDRVLGPTTTHRWCYATAKALDEHLCLAYAKKGLPVTIVRYFNAYGPRATASQYGGVVPKFITAALRGEPLTVYGSGEQTRCFSYIDDTVKGTMRCLHSEHNGHVFNIGTDQRISINALAKKIRSLSGSRSEIVHLPYEEAYGSGYEDTPDRLPDLTKMKKRLKLTSSVDIDSGLLRTIEWYRQQWSAGGGEVR